MSAQQQRGGAGGPAQLRKKTMLNDWRQPHPTSDAPVEGSKYPAQLMWEVTNAAQPRIVLKVNDGVFKEGGGKHKEVELDWADRGQLFGALLEACNQPDFASRTVHIRKKDFVRSNGASRLSDQPITKMTFLVARTKDGAIKLGWMKGDYKVTFTFKGPRDTVIMIRQPDGSVVEDPGLMSRASVRRWINFFESTLDDIERNAWEPPKPKEGATGSTNQSYNNRNNSNSNGGGQAASNDFDDDDSFPDF
jgi:hypothetical protein